MLTNNTIKNFFRNSVVSIPIINFIIGCVLFDKYLIVLTIGLIFTGLFNYIIKYIINISFTLPYKKFFLRPKKAKGCDACCDDLPAHDKIGLPSGHSQIIWFFITYLFLYSYHKYNYYSLFILPFLIILAISVSLSRLGWLGNECHTPFQVIIGSLLGSITGYYCFNIFCKFLGT